MNLKQRVTRYLIGLGIGCSLVFFMFPNYNWLGWTPNNALMKQIRESKFEINARGQCFLDCTATSLEQIQAIRNAGEVDFAKSETHISPKKYRVNYGEVAMDILVTDSLITLIGLENKLSAVCVCR